MPFSASLRFALLLPHPIANCRWPIPAVAPEVRWLMTQREITLVALVLVAAAALLHYAHFLPVLFPVAHQPVATRRVGNGDGVRAHG